MRQLTSPQTKITEISLISTLITLATLPSLYLSSVCSLYRAHHAGGNLGSRWDIPQGRAPAPGCFYHSQRQGVNTKHGKYISLLLLSIKTRLELYQTVSFIVDERVVWFWRQQSIIESIELMSVGGENFFKTLLNSKN